MSKKSKRKQQRQPKIKMSKKQIKLTAVYDKCDDTTELGTIYSLLPGQ